VSDFDLDAAGFRADTAGLSTDVEVLAAKLEDALPGSCRVQRRKRSLFDRTKVVESIEARLGERRYGLQVSGGRVTATREQEVRGVVIKREPLELDAWIQALADDLAAAARTSADARAALERLVG
jgi:hypothetical protein